jgi:acyl-CoA hydrolase
VSPVPGPTGPEAVFDHVGPGDDLIVPLANGEPVSVLDALEAGAERLNGVHVHQMHALHDRPYLHGKLREHLAHVSYFLSPVTRPAFAARGCELVPNNFSEVPRLLRETTRCSMVLAAAAPLDRHGYFSLGTNCDYVAPFIGKVPFLLEVNTRMPRTFGRNQLHVSQVAGWTEVDRPLVEVLPPEPTAVDRRIAELVVERIPDGATIQAGIGAIPHALLSDLVDHRDLGIHTDLLSDALIGLVQAGVVTGTRKRLEPGKVVASLRWARSGSTTSCTRTPRSRCCRSTTSTTRGSSPGRSASSRSTPRPRSTSSASAPRRRSGAATGRRAGARTRSTTSSPSTASPTCGADRCPSGQGT